MEYLERVFFAKTFQGYMFLHVNKTASHPGTGRRDEACLSAPRAKSKSSKVSWVQMQGKMCNTIPTGSESLVRGDPACWSPSVFG